MLYEFIIVITTLAILIKASDFFVEAAAKIAKYLNISEFIIGLTIVAIGTSLPELATSVVAAVKGKTDLILGNVIGSNIANIGLVLGIATIIAPLTVQKKVFNREGRFLFFITFLFFILSLNKTFHKLYGVLFLVTFIIYTIYVAEIKPLKRMLNLSQFLRESYKLEGFLSMKTYWRVFSKGLDYSSYKKLAKEKVEVEPSGKNISEIKKGVVLDTIKQFLIILISGAAIYFSVEYLIPAASDLARQIGASDAIIGLTLIAVGTSLPELVVAISAARKGAGNLLLGTIIGSNISNLLLIIGVSALIRPINISNVVLYYYMPVMVLMTFLLLRFIKTGWVLKLLQGVMFLAFYTIFIASLALFII
jgi:cation:H+ antiporter